MEFNRKDAMSSQEIKRFIYFFENGIKVNANNRETYAKENKLSKAISIYDGDLIAVRKIYELSKLYKDGESLRKAFKRLERYNDDEFLGYYCQKIDEMASYLDSAKEKGLIEASKELVEHEDYYDNHDVAQDYLERYRMSKKIFTDEILDELGISQLDLDYFVEIGEATDHYLEIIYTEKKFENLRERKYQTRKKLDEMYKGITTGFTSDGIPFDELECMNLLPFKNQKQLEELLGDFGARNTRAIPTKIENLLYAVDPDKAGTIYAYMYYKGLLPNVESHVTENDIRKTKNIVNGHEVTKEQKETIIKYMRVRNTPNYPKAVTLVRDKVLSGNIFYDEEEKVLKMKK